ncbi:GNAT family N-acetyltransferase [Marinitenerispora sediminis]|uniref:GNAT family N-acetyltransferase n=1 Tax=Marinitenerispora sediminis TaxID=1931232 RepID=A0A368T8N3_9ACTN|nr:GNAT family N-acetyltransferase [Marinitenerispora sediminis]RCV56540.1 GNAT family N-acetyltransferase [Marinitenerispora sediminis]RCV60109.1 GNAT family N-acetyltransferase [Marinitenerispora sediminis]RCV60362.1 GNAT family N-acetyltransferase [Marinitenerispora sediminis]
MSTDQARQAAAVRVRRAAAGDGRAIATVRVSGWRAAYRGIVPDAFLDRMAPDPAAREGLLRAPRPGVREYLAEVGGDVVGWLAAGPSRDPDHAAAGVHEIYACYAVPGHWRRGVGRALMAAALRDIGEGRAVSLWTFRDNERARRFYEACGFSPDGRERDFHAGAPIPEVRYLRPGTARP